MRPSFRHNTWWAIRGTMFSSCDTRITAHGLGAYIADNTAAGNYPKILLGIAVMSLMVTAFNRLLWRPLYAYAEDRLRLD